MTSTTAMPAVASGATSGPSQLSICRSGDGGRADDFADRSTAASPVGRRGVWISLSD